jgi:hypothetical protein
MLHACVEIFDVMGERGNILGWGGKVNKAYVVFFRLGIVSSFLYTTRKFSGCRVLNPVVSAGLLLLYQMSYSLVPKGYVVLMPTRIMKR